MIKKNTPKKITEKYLKNSGLFYLQKFPASSSHFKFIMMRKINKSIKHHNSPSIEEAQKLLDNVTSYFEEIGFLNDEQYAIGLSRSLFQKGMSEKMISYRLRNKGVNESTISNALSTILPQNADTIAAIRLLKRRKYGQFATKEEKRDTEKTLSLLARSGFSYHTASNVISLSNDEINEIIDN